MKKTKKMFKNNPAAITSFISNHPEIQGGWYHGLRRDIMDYTGYSDPTVRSAIRAGGTGATPKHRRVIRVALQLIREHKDELHKMGIPA